MRWFEPSRQYLRERGLVVFLGGLVVPGPDLLSAVTLAAQAVRLRRAKRRPPPAANAAIGMSATIGASGSAAGRAT